MNGDLSSFQKQMTPTTIPPWEFELKRFKTSQVILNRNEMHLVRKIIARFRTFPILYDTLWANGKDLFPEPLEQHESIVFIEKLMLLSLVVR